MSVTRFDIPNQARFLTFSCYKRLALLSDPKTRDAFVEHLEIQRQRLEFRVIAWVVMPEHAHLIVLPKDGAIGPVLRGIKQGFARSMIRRWREKEASALPRMVDPRGATRFWQRGGGYDRNVRDLEELREKVRYCQWNPVRRGLAARPEEWAWSSARDYAGEAGGIEIWREWR
ncbi:MAG: transposase [Phycisphaerales bacterium JB040]